VRFTFSEDQLLLQSTVKDFLDGEHQPERIRALWETETGRSLELWAQLAELGIPGLLVPETAEGMGMDEIDFVLLQEEAGRAALAEPVISTAAVAVPLLRELAAPEVSDPWLKRVATGDAIVAVGHPVSPFVSDAHIADLLLLHHEGEVHALARDQVELIAEPSNDPARKLFDVRWIPGAATRVADAKGGSELWAAALDRGTLACAAQLLGVSDRLIEMASDYARQRHQFGKPIGSFQAVKHMLANVKVKLEYARPTVHRAAHSVARAVPNRALHASMAKLAASEAALAAAKTALQVHGAVGYTWEQDLHIWMRRAWSLDLAWGTADFHRRRVSDAILADDARLGPGTTFGG
jgi:alkylation response protein AidB-like acyl-CoA dehydrogenase